MVVESYGLPHYIQTVELRHRLIGYLHQECGEIFFSSKKRGFCPCCGKVGQIKKISLVHEGVIDTISINREKKKEKWIGNRAVGIVKLNINGKEVRVPTEFSDIVIPTEVPFLPQKWINQPVEPTARILDHNPDGAIYYGIKFRPVLISREIQFPFLDTLVESERPGIASIGISLPRYRTTADEIANAFHIDPNYIKRGLGVEEVSVPAWDQDTGTFAIDAALDAVTRLPPEFIKTIGMIVVGTESKPYSVKPTATNVQSFLGIEDDIICYDAEFACIAAGMQIKSAIALIRAGEIESALIIGADVSQGKPGDPLDMDTGSGGACFVISKYNVILEYIGMHYSVGDHPDFMRRAGCAYPKHGYGLTGAPSYFAYQETAINRTLKKYNINPDQIKAATFHQPNYNFLKKEVQKYGLDMNSRIKKELKPCIIGDPVRKIGNTYSAATMLGLAAIVNEPKHYFNMDEATASRLGFKNPKKPALTLNQKDIILAGWYGSGAAGGCVLFKVTENYPNYIECTIPFSRRLTKADYTGGKKYVSLLTRYFTKGMIKDE
ncbi:MAG: hydroxymethylglutaryl-CoA synthase [Candidatus Helarchaeota archaeon]